MTKNQVMPDRNRQNQSFKPIFYRKCSKKAENVKNSFKNEKKC